MGEIHPIFVTAHPSDWDWKRLAAELAAAWRREMKPRVVRLVAMSPRTGQFAVAEFRSHRVKALVRAENGHEAYLAIIAEGVPDLRMFALLRDRVPGVASEDWQSEPSPLAEMDPRSREISWSALLTFPSDVANEIVGLDADGWGVSVRKRSGRARSSPTTSTGREIAFAQAGLCFQLQSTTTRDHRNPA